MATADWGTAVRCCCDRNRILSRCSTALLSPQPGTGALQYRFTAERTRVQVPKLRWRRRCSRPHIRWRAPNGWPVREPSDHVDGVRERGVGICLPVKPLALLAVTLALVTATAKATLAHVDSPGQPDPYWQQIVAASAARGAQVPPDGTAPLEGFVSSGGLSLLLVSLGIALALDRALAGVRVTRAGARARRMPATAPSGAPAEMIDEEAIRTVDVLPPSASGETHLVLRAAAAIVFGAFFVSALHASDRGNDSGPQGRDLAPFQMLFRDATPTVQRMFREIQAGLIKAEDMRVATKRWPAVEALAAQAIPPFPLADSPYRWRLLQEGVYAAYLGAPAPESDAPALLALIQEPEPGSVETVIPATPPDELHHRLSDGTLLHVSVWFRPGGLPPDDQVTMATLARPSAAGWTQVLAGIQRP
jgi:hypothetical protein